MLPMIPTKFLRIVDTILLFPVVGLYNFLVYVTNYFHPILYENLIGV